MLNCAMAVSTTPDTVVLTHLPLSDRVRKVMPLRVTSTCVVSPKDRFVSCQPFASCVKYALSPFG